MFTLNNTSCLVHKSCCS